MDFVIILVAGAFMVLACGFGLVFARLISRDRITAPPEDWESVLSPERYRAIERLLEEADQNLLASMGDPEKEKKFRKIRVRIFRGYMQQLSDDFNRIAKAVRLLLASSHAERPEVGGFLMKQQLMFSLLMMSAECKLMLYEFGWSSAQIAGLTRCLNSMRAQLQSLAAIAEPSPA